MAPPVAVSPVKWFVAALWHDLNTVEAAIQRLREWFGEPDFIGPDHPFDVTDYYAQEMGAGLQRRMISFERLDAPERLVAAKMRCNEIENQLAVNGARTVNLDVGYLDHNKLVLGSMKHAGQKIHLADGVYADLVARFKHGRYEPFEWTFPDFRDGRYDLELAEIRHRYLADLRKRRTSANS